jgi:hypothetical protein
MMQQRSKSMPKEKEPLNQRLARKIAQQLEIAGWDDAAEYVASDFMATQIQLVLREHGADIVTSDLSRSPWIQADADAEILQEEREDCETCKGEGREMIDYGNGDVCDVECSMCRGERTKAAYDRALAEINAEIAALPNDGCMCLECAQRKGYDV